MSERLSDFERLSPAKQKLLLARMEKLRRQQDGGEGPARETIPRSPLRETGGPFPLSFSQQRLWFIDRLEPGNTAYNIADALKLRGRLDVPVLARVLTEIVRRHEALRTTFDLAEGRPVQRVEAPAPVAVPVVDLAGLPGEAREAEARRLAAEEARTPFDVPRGPHLRARLLRLAEDEHAALFTTHHIVSDGWSMGVLVREIAALYPAFASGQPSPLPELPLQYPDFADWQRRYLAGEVLEEQIRFWREALAGAPQVLELPADRPRPAVLTHRGASVETVFPRVEAGGGETLFMVLLAAFGALLSRHTGQEDLLVASPMANRNRIETEGLIGFFVNTLTLRIDLRGAETFRDLLARVRQTALGAYAHRDLPFERVVEELQPARDLSRPPLAQVAFALQNAPAGDLALPGLTLATFEVAAETSQMDLTVGMGETPEGLASSWRFNTDLFDEATVRRIAERFHVFLAGIAADPGRPLRDLPLLPEAEREQLLHEWPVGPEPERTERCLHELVFEQALQTPEAPAVVFSGETVTYGELAARALHLARHLASLGVGPEARVGICLERSPEMVVAVLGVLAAGGAYVPLDPAYPQDRFAFMAEDANLAAVVASQSTSSVLAVLGVPAVLVNQEAPARDTPLPEPPLPEMSPDHLAYVIYTSGSTGRPKGVLVSHRAVVNSLMAARRIAQIGPGDRVLQFFSFSFDAAVLDLFHTLGSGACLFLARREELLPGEGLEARLDELGITSVILTPSVLPARPEDFPRLGKVLVGAEKCPAETARRWSAGRRLVNAYGPTEASIFATAWEVEEGAVLPAGGPPIGRPIVGTRAYVFDREGRPAPAGVPGELLLGGAGLARGYQGRPEKTAESFVPDPFSARGGERLYRTGDLVRWLPDGTLEILGRIDHQVKLRGHRIELGEIEASLAAHPDVREAAVLLSGSAAGARLVAYVVPREPGVALPDLRAWLRDRLPEVMIPAVIVPLDAFPLTPNGKLDRGALPEPDAARSTPAEAFVPPRAGLESAVAEVWREVLGVPEVGAGDNFFDLGGHSLLLVEVQTRLKERLGEEVSLLDLFRNPNVGSLARFLAGRAAGTEPAAPLRRERPAPARSREVAVIGMAGRFPGAPDLAAFWRNLEGGVESISFFSEAEILAAGVPPEVLADPNYVRAGGSLEGSDLFDAAFFDIGPREAQILDPQQRAFLECAAEALERSGYGAGSPGLAAVRVGVWAGTGGSDYALRNLAATGVGGFELTIGNDKDFVATRASYKLDLRGPAMTVQTACSTSLVAIHEACRALASGECEMALAGGVTLHFPEASGYLYQEGGIASPDGHNRAFDAKAQGTVGGNGVGVVVLKPLEAALADGDPVRVVIKGSALSNDGSGKVGFTAPSEEGEAEAIAEALAVAGVEPGTVGYVEAHGSATPLGDPIEVAALNRVFTGAAPPGSRALGSVKTNIGHTGSAAGVAGFLRAALALERGVVPPSLHFETPNPRIDFAAGPFRVPTQPEPWPETGGPRRAGVSSFGLGGTNAHAVLEEAPAPEPSGPSRPWQLLSLSARTRTALEAATDRLAAWLEGQETDLADVAFTLHIGRKGFEHRRMLVCKDGEDAREALAAREPRRLFESSIDPAASRSVAFVFSGVGEQYPGMARELYEQEPVFREELDRSAEILLPLLGEDVRKLLFERGEEARPDLRRLFGRSPEREGGALDRTAVLQPALFAVEYALARLWMDWGVVPEALLGYSLGEYVAACIAGVLSLEDALKLVAGRSRLLADLPPGAMLAVPLPADEVAPILPEDLSLAVINGPRISVVAGPPEGVAAFRSRLEAQGHACRALQTTHAFHSAMMAPAAGPLAALAREVTLHPPRIPLLSNVTGTWMTPEQATDPESWARHLVRTVRFADGVATLWGEPGRVLLEIGPGASLSSLALQHPALEGLPDPVALPSLPGVFERRPEGAFLLGTLGKLWLAGVKIDWPRVYARERRRRVELPPYPFERKRYWLEASAPARRAPAEILYVPSWRRSMPLPPPENLAGARWLLFLDETGLGERIAARLRAAGALVATVAAGERFDLDALLSVLGDSPDQIVHLGTVGEEGGFDSGFESLLLLVHELAARLSPEDLAALRALIVSTPTHPGRAPLVALCQALNRELPGVVARAVDVSLPPPSAGWAWDRLAGNLLAELARDGEPWEAPVSLRGAERWVRSFEPVPPRDGALPAGPLLLVGDLPEPLREAVAGLGLQVTQAALDGPFPEGDWAGVIVGEIAPEAPLLPLAVVTRTESLGNLRTAARRLGALETALEGKNPGFVLLTSSLDALAPRPGHGVRGAVHALVDAFAEEERPLPWTSVAWDFESGIDPLAVLCRLLAHGPVARAVALAEDPVVRLARREEGEAAPEGAITLHARPNLRNPYVAPEMALERAIAEMWQVLLGVEQVGVHDSFFDLGGDSLLATQVVTRVRERFGAEVTLPALFEAPTPAGLAGLIEAARPAEGPSDADRLAELLAQLDDLSPEDVERMLAERGE